MRAKEGIIQILEDAMGRRLGCSKGDFDRHTAFHRYGLDSIRATELARELAGLDFARPCTPVHFWEYPTLDALASYLAGEDVANVAPASGSSTVHDAEPIAIVGMACRLPGAPDLSAFWRLLRDGGDAIGELPRERRCDAEADADLESVEISTFLQGGFLERVDAFDASFFGISPREAALMDPQQRLMLEVSWEALEDAGIPPQSLRGTSTGIFTGTSWADYETLVRRTGKASRSAHTSTGLHRSILANRVSYVLGLQGPSMAIDTACSSSLTAVHLACESIRRGEANLALAGGVNLILLPESSAEVSRFGALSPHGRCFTFDARADGYVRGEGAGVVVLKALSRAERDGDRIYGVIHGSAVNNDGASNGLTAPNPEAQEAVLRRAYARSRIEPREVQYVEAHGTGTQLGDPIEARALSAVMCPERSSDEMLRIGSVKTNIGHLEAASGIAGLIKVALSIHHRALPKSLHFETPNPNVAFDDLRLRVQQSTGEWPNSEQPLAAGVSSFGFGGTNAHVVIREHLVSRRPAVDGSAGRLVFVFSGQGTQRPGMGSMLLETEPVFRDVLSRCDALVRRHLGGSVIEAIRAPQPRFDDAGVLIPAMVSLQIALAALWRSWGIRPAAVVGYSVGEIAAAHTAGVLGLEDAMLVACHEGRLVRRTQGSNAAMALVGLSWDDAHAALASFAGRIFPAIHAGSRSTVVAGEWAAIEAFLSALEQKKVFTRRIPLDVAAHSPFVHSLRDEFSAAIERIEPRPSVIPFMSALTGSWLERGDGGSDYWVRNLLEPVQFAPAIAHLGKLGFDTFVELGPHPLVKRDIESTLARDGRSAVVLGSLDRHQDDRSAMLETLGALGSVRERAPALPIVVSGKSELALRAQADRLREHLEAHPDLELCDVAYSLATARSHFEHRAAIVARDRSAAMAALASLAQGGGSPLPDGRGTEDRGTAASAEDRGAAAEDWGAAASIVAVGKSAGSGKLVFVFPGQGSQWQGMARSLLATSCVFRDAIEACERAFSPYVDWSLTEMLGGEDLSSRVDVVQPALFAVMVSLAALWRSMGVVPDAVVGHSQGEIAAAYVAGALSLEDAARIVTLRSRALTKLSGHGAMAAIELGVDALRAYLEPFGAALSVAAINSPRATVVAGAPFAVDALLQRLDRANVFARKIRVDYASHSAHVDALEEELLSRLAGVVPQACTIPLYSTVAGARLSGTELDAAYWFRNLRQPVRFVDATERLLEDGHRFFVEISPHPVLTLALDEMVPSAAVVGSLRRDEGDIGRFLHSLAELHTRGYPVDWDVFFRRFLARRVTLPTYAFRRERFWLDASRSKSLGAFGFDALEHPLLGAAVALADSGGFLFTGRVSLSEHSWLGGHRVLGKVLLPGTAFVDLALVAAHRVGLGSVDELTIEAPLAIPPEGALLLQLSVSAAGDGRRRTFALHARAENDPWTRYAQGTLGPARERDDATDLRAWPPEGAEALSLEGFYERLADAGYAYGADFQGLRAVYMQGRRFFAEIALPDAPAREADRFAVHPALLDAALHVVASSAIEDARCTVLPFSWSGVSLRATGVSALRVGIEPGDDANTFSITLADGDGELIGSVETLACRPISLHEPLLRSDWVPLPERTPSTLQVEWCADLSALRDVVERSVPLPDAIVVPFVGRANAGDVIEAAHDAAVRALELLQAWLAEDRLASCRLVLLTQGAVAAHPDDDVPDLAHAALWGLVRSAQAEHPDHAIFLVDVDDVDAARSMLPEVLDPPERQVALRQDVALAPRLVPTRADEALMAPTVPAWRLDVREKGTLESLDLVAYPEGQAPLGPGEVRIALRAAGLNFRDVLIALGMYPGEASLGSEGAGVVLDIGAEVTSVAPGDRVMGLLHSLGPIAVTDQRLLVPMPEGWSFAVAASVPVVFLTAYYALFDLAQLRAGERLLVHAAAGGVGMAAVQLARHLGAEVFATASPGKWSALDFDSEHIASSRSVDFESHFRNVTQGRGVDVVLDSLAGEFVDASLRLLPRGGRFIEMGKTDVRDPRSVEARYPGVLYRAFDLVEAGPERIQQMLSELVALFRRGELRPLPITVRDVRQARHVFRSFAQARHVGKVVFTLPRALEGTVLVTGGTGTLGALLARHLVRSHGIRHLLLASRQGADAPGAQDLRRELEAEGAKVTVAACDAADRSALKALLDSIPAEQPLVGVVHAAGTLDDGLLASLSAERLRSVLRTKLDAAVHLHELTQHCELEAFVLFSSIAGVLGNPGQANYAAANAFLDALAHHRRAHGHAALSLAWGLWERTSGLTAQLTDADRHRLARGGIRPLSSERGLALFDAALARPDAAFVAAAFDGRAAPRTSRAAVPSSPRARLVALSVDEQERTLLGLVRSEAATVLGLPAAAIEPHRPLQQLGLDSLMAVELRNRLAAATELRFRATLLFDHPTPAALARFLQTQMVPQKSDAPAARTPVRESDVTNLNEVVRNIESASDDELFELYERVSQTGSEP